MKLGKTWNTVLSVVIIALIALIVLGVLKVVSHLVLKLGGVAIIAGIAYLVYKAIKERK